MRQCPTYAVIFAWEASEEFGPPVDTGGYIGEHWWYLAYIYIGYVSLIAYSSFNENNYIFAELYVKVIWPVSSRLTVTVCYCELGVRTFYCK